MEVWVLGHFLYYPSCLKNDDRFNRFNSDEKIIISPMFLELAQITFHLTQWFPTSVVRFKDRANFQYQLPPKIILDSKVIKIDPNIIVSLC